MTALNVVSELAPGEAAVAASDAQQQRPLAPALGWAAGGGLVLMVVGALVYVLAITALDSRAGAMQGAMSALDYRPLVGIFVAGFLTILVVQEVGVRTP